MIQLSDNSIKVLQRRYLLRNGAGSAVETPSELFLRVAKYVASAELHWGKVTDATKWEEKFYGIMSSLLFLPNSPTLMNAGTSNNQLSACFVLPVEDNMTAIFTTLKNAALIQQSGGGTGFNFSHLRPKNDMVNSHGATASGPVSFMKIFDAATGHIKQGGRRRGANMGILNIDHPDIEEFIAAKKEKSALTNFNISVGITDAFMHALENNADWQLVHPNTKTVIKKLSARHLWQSIAENAWQTGDPGLIFIDSINAANPTPDLGQIECTNPCGEVPLLSYEPCNLGSVNLSKFIQQNNGCYEINWRLLEDVLHTAIRFLDNVIEVNNYIIPEIKTMAMGNRKIGLGVMGWAELLILLEIPYASEQAVRLAEQLMQFVQETCLKASVSLAKERGSFPNYEKSICRTTGTLRNATRTSIAPTGTISIIAGTSSSIEPLFALAFQRHEVLNGENLFSVNRLFVTCLKKQKLYTEKIMKQAIEEGMANNIKELPVELKNIFLTAIEIPPRWHLLHQLAFQKYTDNAVSKTINLPENTTVNDVEDIYKTAWQNRAKGITIFRNKSKGRQVMYPGIRHVTKGCKVCIE